MKTVFTVYVPGIGYVCDPKQLDKAIGYATDKRDAWYTENQKIAECLHEFLESIMGEAAQVKILPIKEVGDNKHWG